MHTAMVQRREWPFATDGEPEYAGYLALCQAPSPPPRSPSAAAALPDDSELAAAPESERPR